MVTNLLEKVMRRFLWAGCSNTQKIHWVAWDRVTLGKKEGGLGIPRLSDVNDALLFKWGVRYKMEGDMLWKKVVSSCHKTRARFGSLPMNVHSGGNWKRIAKNFDEVMVEGKPLHWCFKAQIGDGQHTRFWQDCWLFSEPLWRKWPNLYEMDTKNFCLVAERVNTSGHRRLLAEQWLKRSLTHACFTELTELLSAVSQLRRREGADFWVWKGPKSDIFSVKEIRMILCQDSQLSDLYRFRWTSWVPLKCNLLAWRAEMNRLPVKLELLRRNIQIGNSTCPMCNWQEESVEHLFTGCSVAHEVWLAIGNWCGVGHILVFSVRDILEAFRKASDGKKGKKIVRGIFIIASWCLWIARNEKIFHNKEVVSRFIISNVKRLSFFWLAHRSSFKDLDWNSWRASPVYML